MPTRLRLCAALCLAAGTAVVDGRTRAVAVQSAPTVEVLHAFADPPAYPWSEVLPMPDGTIYGTTRQGGGLGTIYRRNVDGSLTLLHSFNGPGGDLPGTRLALVNGFIYFLVQGGPHGAGAIYRMNVATDALTLLHAFTGGADGGNPQDGLELATDGFLYGAAADGGPANKGVVYRVDPGSGAVTTVHAFMGSDGASPRVAPVQGADGLLYGTTGSGGSASRGTLYRLDPVSGALTTLQSFMEAPHSPSPISAFIRATDGFFYGTTDGGGAFGGGMVFRVNPASGAVTVMHSFALFDGIIPDGRLVQGPDGMLYGASTYGGSANGGVVYRVNPATDAVTTVHEFAATPFSGTFRQHALARGSDGLLYGVSDRSDASSDSGGGRIYRFDVAGGRVEIVHRFSDMRPGGSNPFGLTPGSDGLFYGATQSGGTQYVGTLFRSTLSGAITTLHSFDPFRPTGDGITPNGSLTEGLGGTFYGVTRSGFDNGSVFRLNSDGTVTILHKFSWIDQENGMAPVGRLLKASNGYLYGVTEEGGAIGRGTIFKIDPVSGSFATLHSFWDDWNSAQAPASSLIEASGFLYGTTSFGGASSEGTIYRLDLATNAVSIIHSFDPAASAGYRPFAALTAAPDGYMYGTTQAGGVAQRGALFRFDPATGAMTTVAGFGTDALSGRTAMSELVFRSGVLYGTTAEGGAHDRGTIYSLDPATNAVATLYSLDESVGRSPRGALALGPDGVLYGVASQEGPLGGGTLFRLRLTPDVTAPTVSIASPAAATYPLHANILASYTCTDSESGIASCTGTVANGAAIDTATLGPKTFTLDATDNAGNTTSQRVTYSVTKAATTTTITSTTPNPSSALQFVRLTATVNGAANVKPTGFVHFYNGATFLGSSEVNGFQNAAITTTALGAGTHSLTATYLGDASFDRSTSASVAHTVHPLATSTITALFVSPAQSSLAGSTANLVAIVAPLGGTGAPGGTVEFFEHSTSLGAAPLLPWSSYQVAVLPTSGLAAGLHVLQARYPGDGTFGGSISATTLHTVYTNTPPAATTTTVTTTPNPSAFGQPFSLTIEVRSPDGVPFGPVHLYSNGWMIGQHWLTLSGGVGRVTIPMTGLPRGLYVLSAMYIGFAQFGASSSQNVYHCVGCPLGTALQSSTPVR